MKNILIAVFALGLLVIAGCSSSEPAQPTDTPSPKETPVPEVMGDSEKGRQIFENGGANELSAGHGYLCTSCHTVDGSGEKTHNGPELKGISERGADTVPGLSAAQYIHQSIMDPRAYVVDGYAYMSVGPSRTLTEEEVADLVAYLLTQ
jgi:cytochrome c2